VWLLVLLLVVVVSITALLISSGDNGGEYTNGPLSLLLLSMSSVVWTWVLVVAVAGGVELSVVVGHTPSMLVVSALPSCAVWCEALGWQLLTVASVPCGVEAACMHAHSKHIK
jgi:hypothetical protein